MGLYTSMSSAYKENFVLSESWIEVILLTYVTNRSGPKTEPHELNESVSHSLQHAALSLT